MVPKKTYTILKLRRGAPVAITSGMYTGKRGKVESPVYHQGTADDPGAREHGYRVTLDNGDVVVVGWYQVKLLDH